MPVTINLNQLYLNESEKCYFKYKFYGKQQNINFNITT